jgi:hypothetical protein
LQRSWHQKPTQVVGFGNRSGQSDLREPRRQREQPCETERQQVAALSGDQRV